VLLSKIQLRIVLEFAIASPGDLILPDQGAEVKALSPACQGNRIWIFAVNERLTNFLSEAPEHHFDGYFGVNSITDGQVRLPCPACLPPFNFS
jgi:hypothetical protein